MGIEKEDALIDPSLGGELATLFVLSVGKSCTDSRTGSIPPLHEK